jgi:hypothetical protein
MTSELTTLLAALAGGMVLAAMALYWWMNRTPREHRGGGDAPLPLFGGHSEGEQPRPMPRSLARAPQVGAAPAARPEPLAPSAPRGDAQVTNLVTPAAPAPEAERPRPVIREFTTIPAPPEPVPPPTSAPNSEGVAVLSAAGVPGTMVEAHTIRYSVPAEGTLQFLPGRLEIGSGLDAGREIRFVRVDGPEGHVVTFGRADGELYRHIQLREQTVSRAHARMEFRDGCWWLQNLSATNPVAHNGAELTDQAFHPLADGDRVEMGEVIFTFRSR